MTRTAPTLMVFALALACPRTAEAGEEPIEFARDIRPVLSRACFACHGPDAEAREAKLRLDVRANALGEDGSFAAILAGDAASSEVWSRITDADDGMPPKDSGFELTRDEVARIGRWINEGAKYEEHWAFVAPVKVPPPSVREEGLARSELDLFVQAVLDERGLAPSQEADARTLLRRVTLDLTGLPPTLAEIQSFLTDEQPGAYERVVERLLASPSYGEHMARHWLDVARYADTHGLHLDNYREVWPYRDRVIESFNSNLPYDDFVVEQLAGDLLPDATLDQIVASGFNRCNVTTNEGGSIDEEVYVRNVVDRVNTTGTAFLGLTLGCAACHDHKFDPITQREFYSLFAFFNNLEGDALDGNVKDHKPVVRVPSEAQSKSLERLKANHDAAEARVVSALATIEYEEVEVIESEPLPEHEFVWLDDELPVGAVLEGDALKWVDGPANFVHSGARSLRLAGQGKQQHLFRDAEQRLRVGAGDKLFCWVRFDLADAPRELMMQFNQNGAQDWAHRAFWGEDLLDFGITSSAGRKSMGKLPVAGEWIRLEVAVEDIGLFEGDVIHGFAATQYDGTVLWDRVGIITRTTQRSEDYIWIGDELPVNAKASGEGQSWNWITQTSGPVFEGERSIRSVGSQQVSFTGATKLPLHKGDRLFAHVWIDPNDPTSSIQMRFNDGSWQKLAIWGTPTQATELAEGEGFLAGELPEFGSWQRLEVNIEDVGLTHNSRLTGWTFAQVGGTVHWDSAGMHSWSQHNDDYLYSQTAWEQRARSDARLAPKIRKAANVPRKARTQEQTGLLRDYYLRYYWAGSRDLIVPLQKQVEAAIKQITNLYESIPTSLVMREREVVRPAYILERGDYGHQLDEVSRSTPAFLPAMSTSLPQDRLGFARWLVEPNHPLTARVAVNRFWQQIFGTGLVRTSEDFGNQGELPSHPELLDWLAVRFVESNWDVKALMRELVTSATYRQSSVATQAALKLDPKNRLLSHGPRFRLDAEVLRDQALAVSGLLAERVGGAPVKPPQPDGIWKAVAYVGSNTEKFVADTEHEDVHRRSLYTFIKRSAPPPQFSILDAPDREACRTRRERTNTPMQALLLMNDPQFLEAARQLALRVLSSKSADSRERVVFAFEACTAQLPDEEDVNDMLSLLLAQRRELEAHPARAWSLASIGASSPAAEVDPVELASWLVVCNLILNLDVVLVKG